MFPNYYFNVKRLNFSKQNRIVKKYGFKCYIYIPEQTTLNSYEKERY